MPTLTQRMDALEGRFDSIEATLGVIAKAVAAKSAPAGKGRASGPVTATRTAKPSSDFTAALAAKREAKLKAGTHRACTNCGKAVSIERTADLCKECLHATPKARAARARR